MGFCHDSSFDLFSRPPTEMGLKEFTDQEIQPVTAITKDTTTIDFNVSGEGEEYLDMSETRLYVKIKVTKEDGTAVDKADTLSLVRHWPQALFRQADLLLNGTLVTTSSSMYMYNAMVSSLLSFPKDVKKDQLKVLEHIEGTKIPANSGSIEALIRLHLPLCHQLRLLPNNVNLSLRLLRNGSDFLCQTTEPGYKGVVEIQKCLLYIRRVTPTPTMALHLAEQMKNQNCLYPIQRLTSKYFTLAKGTREFDVPNICTDQLPSRIMIGFVDTAAFSGDQTLDPFKFEPFKLDYLSLTCNGRAYPSIPLTADFPNKIYRRAYQLLLDTIQGPCEDTVSLGIDGNSYTTDSCFFGFTLARALSGLTAAVPPREKGYVNAKIRFKDNLDKNVNAIVFLEFDNNIEIDSARNIYTDFAA